MTVEMGPRDDGELALSELAAANLMDKLVRVFDYMADDSAIRFNPESATLSLSGESENAGDAFDRGKIVASLVMGTALLSMTPMMFVGKLLSASSPIVTAVGFVLTAAAGVTAIFISSGATDLMKKIRVIDHTTEPAPDAVDELKERYVAGEIDDTELEREAAEVWER